MEEQKRRKEELAQKAKIEEEMEERRLIQERERLAGRERREMYKESGKVVEEPKLRKVNRSQFEQSAENGGPTFKP
jgi:hypothetical protein